MIDEWVGMVSRCVVRRDTPPRLPPPPSPPPSSKPPSRPNPRLSFSPSFFSFLSFPFFDRFIRLDTSDPRACSDFPPSAPPHLPTHVPAQRPPPPPHNTRHTTHESQTVSPTLLPLRCSHPCVFVFERRVPLVFSVQCQYQPRHHPAHQSAPQPASQPARASSHQHMHCLPLPRSHLCLLL